MWAEGSSLGLVWPLLADKDLAKEQKLEVYDRTYLRDFFVDICDDDEMARGIPDADLFKGGLPQEFKDESDPTKGYSLQDFNVHAHYDIEYARTELRIKVRIKFTGETPDNQHMTIWRTGIENKWNNKFHIENGKHLAIVVEPQFNAPSAHHSVEVHKGPPVKREDASNWTAGPNHDTSAGTQDTTDGNTASHEFGHLVGMDYEYNLTAADFQKYTGAAPVGPMPADGYDTTSVMGGSVTGPVEGRHMRPFVDWLNRNKLPGEKPYRLVAGP